MYLESCNVTQLDDVSFYNNTAAVSGGAAIRAINSTIHITGAALFKSNAAVVSNGGAVYLQTSNMTMHKGDVTFQNNTANNGGAIFIDSGSQITYLTQTVKNLKFVDNVAISHGAAMYVTTDPSKFYGLYFYYHMLRKAKCLEDNTANSISNCAYFNFSAQKCEYSGSHNKLVNKLFSSPICRMIFKHAVVTIDAHYQDDEFV